MKLFKSFLLPLLALTLVFTACEREAEIDEIEVPDITVPAPETVESVNVYARNNGQNDEGLDFDCFVVLYPFALVNDEGAEYAINEEADLVALQDTEIIDFVYPLDVDQDGELSSIASGEELAMLFAGCIPDGGWDDGFFPAYLISFDNSCYEFVYPISLENWEGETVTANNESEFNTAITNEPHNFIFPFSIVDEDGEVISVADIDELFDALFDCNGFSVGDSTVWDYEVGFEYIGCYMVEFPIDIVLDDGTVVTVNNHEEMCEYMFEGSIADYTYPLTLISEEGEEVVVGSAEELEELLAECWEWVDNFSDLVILYLGSLDDDQTGQEACYEINYPIQGIDIDGNVTEINDQSALEEIISSSNFYSVMMPISITLTEDNSIVELTSFEDLIEVLANCE